VRDVAARAGVSAMTVSRVLQRDERVRPQARERVLEAVAALGYRRNEAARHLRQRRRAGLIGLVVTNLGSPFHARLAVGVESLAVKHGFGLVLGNTGDDPERERDLVRDLADRGTDGLIVVPAGPDQAHLRPPALNGVPVVFAGRPPADADADCVLVDDFGGARRATAALIGAGHRRLAFLGNPPTAYSTAERLRGFRAALADAGVEPDDRYTRHLRYADPDIRTAERATLGLLDLPDPPTGLFAADNRVTLGAYQAVTARGADLALAGFDDFELAAMLGLPLTVVSYDAGEVGRRAAELLVNRLREGEPAGRPPERVLVTTSLVNYREAGR
jgi:LacI family transcriptional regulator